MDDRELLEAAARAAGLEWSQRIAKEREGLGLISLWVTTPGHIHTAWNPLDDDGAALRLAVSLGIRIWGAGHAVNREGRHCVEGVGVDEFANTRRAIVRAAAALTSQEPHR